MVIFYVLGAYLKSDMEEDKFILLKIGGKFVDIMCEVNFKHKKMWVCRMDYSSYTYKFWKLYINAWSLH